MTEPITKEERELFWDRYYNRQVCSPPQNWCRNNPLIDELGTALQAAEARIAKLEAALRELVEHCYDCDGSGFVRRQIGPAKEIKCPVCLPARAALGETDENAG